MSKQWRVALGLLALAVLVLPTSALAGDAYIKGGVVLGGNNGAFTNRWFISTPPVRVVVLDGQLTFRVLAGSRAFVPAVLFRDPTDSDAPFILRFSRDWWRAHGNFLWFAGPSCTGLAYALDPEIFEGLPGLRRTTYVRRPNEMLYRTLLGGMGTGRSVMTESFFRSFDGTNRINGCQEATATRILVVQATAQIDLSNLTPQFMVE